MTHRDLLLRLVETLEGLKLDYLITGSTASIFFGEVRLTNDIDVVVELPSWKVAGFCAAFPSEEFYVSEGAARDAASRGGQFNIIHPSGGLKIDVMVAKDTPFDESRFARARRIQPAEGVEARFASPEDVILKKMECYREGGSEKHLRDIAGILRVSGAEIDRAYIGVWAPRLGVTKVWEAIMARLGSTGPGD